MTKAQGSIKLGTLLVEMGHLTDQGLQEALAEQQRSSQRLGDVLKYLGLITEDVLLDCLAKQFGIKRISLSAVDLNVEYSKCLPAEIAKEKNVILYREEQGMPVLVVADPADFDAVGKAAKHLGKRPIVYCAMQNEISHLINLIYAQTSQSLSGASLQNAPTGTVNTFVKTLFETAVFQGASDIHIDGAGSPATVRFRIDGVLRTPYLEHTPPGPTLLNRLSSTFSVPLTNAQEIHESYSTFNVTKNGEHLAVDVRISLFGKKMVIRLDPAQDRHLALESIGLRPDVLDALQHRLTHTQGITLFASPAGAGRTSSLYSAAEYLNTPENNIIAFMKEQEHVRNGVQYVDSTQFSAGRVMRRDPDVIMTDEIEDADTLNSAMRFASTGVKVLSTINAPGAKEACLRLIHLSEDSYVTAMRLDVVVAQRLLKQNCPHCRTSRSMTDAERALLVSRHVFLSDTVYDSVGCDYCHGYGVKGRVAAFEMLTFSEEMRFALQARDIPRFNRLVDEALNNQGILDHTARLVKSGEISVTQLINMINYPLE